MLTHQSVWLHFILQALSSAEPNAWWDLSYIRPPAPVAKALIGQSGSLFSHEGASFSKRSKTLEADK